MAALPRSSIEKFPLLNDTDLESSKSPAEHNAKKAHASQSWWARQKLLRKAFYVVGAATVVIGLAVGLSVGLTVSRDDEHHNDDLRIRAASPSQTAPVAFCQEDNCLGTGGVWQPEVGVKWQIILSAGLKLPASADSIEPQGAEVYDIDLFENSEKVIQNLHLLGKHVICYFSAGSYEPYRPDSDDFKDSDLGKGLVGWPGEKWLDTNSANVRSIMAKRIQLAADKGCDAIDPDNIDGYQNNNGLGLTKKDAINYMKFLSKKATALNMAIGLKNAGDIIDDVIDYTHFSVNEECVDYSECEVFAKYTKNNKPVFHIEYPDKPKHVSDEVRQKYCSGTGKAKGSADFSTVLKDYDLDGFVQYCDGNKATTPMKD